MDNILEKIKKLLALSTSSNPHEAALAASKAQELMVKYAIEETQLSDKPNEPVESQHMGLGFQRVPKWQALLSFAVAPAFFCRSFFIPKVDVIVVGRKTDREIHIATFNYLVYQLENMAEKAWNVVKEERELHGKAWKQAFYYGACAIIKERLTENAKQITGGNESHAIVLYNKAKDVDDYMDKKHPKLRKAHRRAVDAGGYVAGAAAARTLNLSGKATKKLGGNNG